MTFPGIVCCTNPAIELHAGTLRVRPDHLLGVASGDENAREFAIRCVLVIHNTAPESKTGAVVRAWSAIADASVECSMAGGVTIANRGICGTLGVRGSDRVGCAILKVHSSESR
jgi:hypothetical protein